MQLLKFLPFVALVAIVSSCQNESTPPMANTTKAVKESLKLEGELGSGYSIRMKLNVFDDQSVTGAYQYEEGTNSDLTYLKGTLADGNIMLAEFSYWGEQTGTLNGTVADGLFRGKYDTRYDSLDFVLTTKIDTVTFDGNMQRFDMINFDAYEIYSTDYAITRLEIFRNMDDPESIFYDPGCVTWYDCLDSFEALVNDFELFVNNFDKNDEKMMSEFGAKMTDYLNDFGYYFTCIESIPPRLSVDYEKTYTRFNTLLTLLQNKL